MKCCNTLGRVRTRVRVVLKQQPQLRSKPRCSANLLVPTRYTCTYTCTQPYISTSRSPSERHMTCRGGGAQFSTGNCLVVWRPWFPVVWRRMCGRGTIATCSPCLTIPLECIRRRRRRAGSGDKQGHPAGPARTTRINNAIVTALPHHAPRHKIKNFRRPRFQRCARTGFLSSQANALTAVSTNR